MYDIISYLHIYVYMILKGFELKMVFDGSFQTEQTQRLKLRSILRVYFPKVFNFFIGG